jgi:hypothetical protein
MTRPTHGIRVNDGTGWGAIRRDLVRCAPYSTVLDLPHRGRWRAGWRFAIMAASSLTRPTVASGLRVWWQAARADVWSVDCEACAKCSGTGGSNSDGPRASAATAGHCQPRTSSGRHSRRIHQYGTGRMGTCWSLEPSVKSISPHLSAAPLAHVLRKRQRCSRDQSTSPRTEYVTRPIHRNVPVCSGAIAV